MTTLKPCLLILGSKTDTRADLKYHIV